jgi:archaetidylinositol phosphate synthase
MPYRRLKIVKSYIDRVLAPTLRYIGRFGIRPIHLTLLSLPFGVLGVMALYDSPTISAFLIGIYLILDVLDGTLARVTGTESEFGARLDFMIDRIVAALFLLTMYFRTNETALPIVGLVFIVVFSLEDIGLVRR